MAMESSAPPSITSFVIRFVMDETAPDTVIQPSYRGTIRHIQSDNEMNFNTWEDAVAFIQHYVPLETKAGRGGT